VSFLLRSSYPVFTINDFVVLYQSLMQTVAKNQHSPSGFLIDAPVHHIVNKSALLFGIMHLQRTQS